MQLDVQLLGDASKNCIVWARGSVSTEDEGQLETLVSLDQIGAPATGRKLRTLQLCTALWTLQEKLGLRIWMGKEYRPSNLLLLMESRNFIRLDRPLSLDNWSGTLYIEPYNIPEPKHFWFQLDFDKVIER